MRDYEVLPQVLVAIAANFGPFLYGVSLGWSAPAGPQLVSEENDFPMTLTEFSLAVAAMPLGAAMFCVLSGLFRNRFGTRFTILSLALPNLLGWLALMFAWNTKMIIAGRMLIGIAGGAYSFIVPVFIGEFSSKEIRGVLLTLYQVFVKIGVVFVYSLGSTVSLFTLSASIISIVIIYTTCFMILPESPVFLVRKKELKKAENSIRVLRGKNYNASLEVLNLQKLNEEIELAPKKTFREEITKHETFKAFTIIIFLFFFFQMTGINAVISYTTTIFTEAGLTIEPSKATIILGIIQLIVTLSTAAFIDRFGRIFLLTTSFILSMLGLVGIGIFFILKERKTDVSCLSWLPLPSLCLFTGGFHAGLASVPFVLVGEIFSNDAKKIIAPFAQTMNFVMSTMIGVLFPFLTSSIGTGTTFLMFAGFCFVGLLFTVLVIPETKGKSLSEIQSLLRN